MNARIMPRWVLVVAAGVAVVVLWMWREGTPSSLRQAPEVAETWPQQRAASYTFTLSETTELWLAPTAQVTQPPMHGVLAVEGRLTLEPDSSQRLWTVQITQVTDARAEITGHPIQSPEELARVLQRGSAAVAWNQDGTLEGLRFEATEEPVFENALHALAGLMQLAQGGPEYTAEETDARGTLAQRYTVRRQGAVLEVHKEPLQMVSLTGYPNVSDVTVDGSTKATLDEKGLVGMAVNREVLGRSVQGTPLLRSRSALTLQRENAAPAALAAAAHPRVRAAAPRLVACIVVTPLLVGACLLAGLVSSYLIATLQLGVDQGVFVSRLLENISLRDLVSALVKALGFGMLTGTLACWHGYAADAGAASVGQASNRTVVQAMVTGGVLNLFVSNVFYGGLL